MHHQEGREIGTLHGVWDSREQNDLQDMLMVTPNFFCEKCLVHYYEGRKDLTFSDVFTH
jgi:hypothetical protein